MYLLKGNLTIDWLLCTYLFLFLLQFMFNILLLVYFILFCFKNVHERCLIFLNIFLFERSGYGCNWNCREALKQRHAIVVGSIPKIFRGNNYFNLLTLARRQSSALNSSTKIKDLIQNWGYSIVSLTVIRFPLPKLMWVKKDKVTSFNVENCKTSIYVKTTLNITL